MMTGFLEYVPGESLMHRMNPVIKLACAFLIAIACFVTTSPVLLACVLVLDVILARQCGMLPQAMGLAKAVAAFSIILAAIALLFTPEGERLVFLPWGYIGTQSVFNACMVIARLVACAIPLFLAFYVTKLTDFANSLVENAHMPYKYAFVFTSCVRFIPVFMNDMAAITEAQTARGVEFDGGLAKRIRLMVPLCVPLLVSSVRKTNSSAIAAEVRGFYLRGHDSAFKRYPIGAEDGACVAFCIMLLVLAIVQRIML